MLIAVVVAAIPARRPSRISTVDNHAPVVVNGAAMSSDAAALPPLRGEMGDGGASDAGARMQHGGPRRTHRVHALGPKTLEIGWKTDVGGPVAAQVTTSPDEATLYVATLGGDLVALARLNGAKLWTVKLGDRGYAAPLVLDDGSIWVGSDAKKMFGVTPAGAIVHRIDLEGEADTSAVNASDGTIVFAAGSRVMAIRRGGDVAWRFAAKGKVFTAPAITADGYVIAGSQDHRVYAIDQKGVAAWSTDLGADVDGAPVIGDDGAIYVGTDAGEVVRLEPNGKIAWRAPAGGFVRGGLSLGRNGDVLVGTYGPAPRVIRVGPDGALKGAFSIQGTGAKEFGIHGGPLEDDEGALYFGTQDDAVYALDPDGSVRWSFKTGADVDAPLTLLEGGGLVVPSEDGSVTLLVP